MGAVNTTYTFTANDTITSTKMNNIIDQTTMTSDAIFGTTLEVASGKLKVRSQGITSNELAADSVTSAKIANGAVTSTQIEAFSIAFDRMSVSAIATTAQAKTETASVLITADNVKQTPPAAKAYGSFTVATTSRILSGAYNVLSVTRISANSSQVTFATGGSMASSSYVVVAQTTDSGTTPDPLDQNAMPYDKTASGFKIYHNSELIDRAVDFVVFGTLA
jgi:hypothetical protein